MKTFATGLSGTIGRHLLNSAIELQVRLDEIPEDATLELDGAQVIHLAGVVGEHRVTTDLNYSHRVNVIGTRNLANAVARSRAKKFVFVSTSHVYQLASDLKALSEESPVLPRGHYALQKLLGEQLVIEAFRSSPERLVIARVFSVLEHSQPPGTLGHTIEQLAVNSESTLSCADDERDFLSPRIIAEILLRLANTEDANGTFNVCSGIALSVRDAAQLVLGDAVFERVSSRVSPGRSTSPRIIGNPRRLLNRLKLDSSDLHRQFVSSLHIP
jgi:nucleoside-diphosphate-sugar epimerase